MLKSLESFILPVGGIRRWPGNSVYNEAITTAPESTAAREAEQKIANLRVADE